MPFLDPELDRWSIRINEAEEIHSISYGSLDGSSLIIETSNRINKIDFLIIWWDESWKPHEEAARIIGKSKVVNKINQG